MSTSDIVARFRAGYLDMHAEHFDDALTACESPIEALFLATFLAAGARSLGGIVPDGVAASVEIGDGFRMFEDGAVVVPQARPHGLPYRIDFALLHDTEPRVRVAVELDGHDFHEKTKEQAARDKSRDRDLTEAGWLVVRFTGSEVYRDADACRLQALTQFYRASRRLRSADQGGPICVVPARQRRSP